MYSHSVHVTTSSTVHFLTYAALYLRPEYKKKGNACMHHGPFFSAPGSGPKGRGGRKEQKNKNLSREFPIFIFIFLRHKPPPPPRPPRCPNLYAPFPRSHSVAWFGCLSYGQAGWFRRDVAFVSYNLYELHWDVLATAFFDYAVYFVGCR